MRLKSFLLLTALALPLLSALPAAANDVPPPPEAKTEKPVSYDHMARKPEAPLPEAKVKMIHETMEKAHADNKPIHEAIFRLDEEMRALTAAPTFEKDVFIKKSTDLQNLKTLLAAKKAETVAAILAQLTPEERIKFSSHIPPHGMMDRPMMHHHNFNQDAAPMGNKGPNNQNSKPEIRHGMKHILPTKQGEGPEGQPKPMEPEMETND